MRSVWQTTLPMRSLLGEPAEARLASWSFRCMSASLSTPAQGWKQKRHSPRVSKGLMLWREHAMTGVGALVALSLNCTTGFRDLRMRVS